MAYDTPSQSSCSTSESEQKSSCCGGGCHSMPAYELSITDAAASQVKSIAKDGQFLRVFVYEGGCAGMKVGFDLDDTTRPGDVEFQADGARIVADTESLSYIDGTTVDYVTSVAVSRFALINQNAQAGCGCGSFSKSSAA